MTRLGWIALILFIAQAAFFGISISDFNRFADNGSWEADSCDDRWGRNSSTPDDNARLNCLDDVARNVSDNQTKALYCWAGLALGSVVTLFGVWRGWRNA